MKSLAIMTAVVLTAGPVWMSGQQPADAVLCDQIVGSPASRVSATERARALITSRPGAASAHFLNGCLSFADAKPDKAADFFEKAAQLEPRSLYFDWLGRAYGDQAQRASKVRQPLLARKTRNAFERSVALDPDNLDARTFLSSFYQQAPGVMGGSDAKAREQVDAIRQRNPYRGALVSAGYNMRDGNAAAAEREYVALTRSHADSLQPWTGLIQVQMNAKRWSDAFLSADKLRARPSRQAIGDYMLGRIAAQSGEQLERGEAALRRYLATAPTANEPTLASAHYRLGQVLQHAGRSTAAKQEYQQVLTLQSGHEGAKKALATLR